MEMDQKKLNIEVTRLIGQIDPMVKEGLFGVDKIELVLQDDPTSNTTQLQTNVATTQRHLSFVSSLIIKAMRSSSRLESCSKRAGWLLEQETNSALLDAEIKVAKPKAVQEAMIAEHTCSITTFCNELDLLSYKMTTYQKILTESQNYIRRTMTNLSMQVGILKVERSLGTPSDALPDNEEGDVPL